RDGPPAPAPPALSPVAGSPLKPYGCEECGKSYRLISLLNLHKKRHSADAVSAPLQFAPSSCNPSLRDGTASSLREPCDCLK
uniref:C2H2-type domain-containing protein n=1 Tax=Ursus americanus TaxID=9643 RepID=A0A452R0X4_URSAM